MLSPENWASPAEAFTVVVPDNVPLPGFVSMAMDIDVFVLSRRLLELKTITEAEKVLGFTVFSGETVNNMAVAVGVVPSIIFELMV
jgi:hypothetical protein